MTLEIAANWIKSSLKSAIACLMLAYASPATAQTLQTLYSFNGTNGAYPQAAVTLGNDGELYGTTLGSSLSGAVFRVTTNGTLTTLVPFNSNVMNSNGANSHGTLAMGSDGSRSEERRVGKECRSRWS